MNAHVHAVFDAVLAARTAEITDPLGIYALYYERDQALRDQTLWNAVIAHLQLQMHEAQCAFGKACRDYDRADAAIIAMED